ncbi:MAG: hypothetical protein U5K33_09715 [Halofilum sp. (in: g-proteobacteria)]|nr:hypothetical protein [Halofilum sp. (in: g-proteobacteria)]
MPVLKGDSLALQADALDFLGDSATYAISLWVIGRPVSHRALAALVQGPVAWARSVCGCSVHGVLSRVRPRRSERDRDGRRGQRWRWP